MTRRINRDDLEKLHDLNIHIPSKTITLFGDINQENAENFIKNFHILELDTSDKPITILLNTDGGDMEHGMAIYDTIIKSDTEVHINVIGNAYSMGCIILQAGDWRRITKHSTVMFHKGSITHENVPYKEIRSTLDFDDRYSQLIDDIVYEKVAESSTWSGGHMILSKEQFDSMNEKATYLRGIEAVEWGLVDEVV